MNGRGESVGSRVLRTAVRLLTGINGKYNVKDGEIQIYQHVNFKYHKCPLPKFIFQFLYLRISGKFSEK